MPKVGITLNCARMILASVPFLVESIPTPFLIAQFFYINMHIISSLKIQHILYNYFNLAKFRPVIREYLLELKSMSKQLEESETSSYCNACSVEH